MVTKPGTPRRMGHRSALSLHHSEPREEREGFSNMGAASSPVRLPKLVERDPRASQLLHILASNTRPLWRGAEIEVPQAGLSPELSAALLRAKSAGMLARGLESAKRILAAEERGLRLADARSSVARGSRISRLLLIAGDGAERFYRHVEKLLLRHAPRVIAVRLEVDAAALGELLFGPGHPVRLLMIEHKDAVCSILLAMASQEEAGPLVQIDDSGSGLE